MTKIKTTHVGSLPRSNELSELLFKKDQKEQIDFNQFERLFKKMLTKLLKNKSRLELIILAMVRCLRLVMLLMLRIELMDFLVRVREKHQKI